MWPFNNPGIYPFVNFSLWAGCYGHWYVPSSGPWACSISTTARKRNNPTDDRRLPNRHGGACLFFTSWCNQHDIGNFYKPKSVVGIYLFEISDGEYQLGMLLNESPYGARIFPMHCTIRQLLRTRFPNNRFGLKASFQWHWNLSIVHHHETGWISHILTCNSSVWCKKCTLFYRRLVLFSYICKYQFGVIIIWNERFTMTY